MKRLPLLLALTLAAAAVMGQDHPVVQTGFAADKVYNFHGIDSVNTFNGNLTVTIPIGFRFPVSGGLNYGLTLTYNSKVWSYLQVTNLCGGASATACPLIVMRAEPSHRSNAGMGWLVSLGRIVPPEDPMSNDPNGGYQTGDGAVHSLFGSLHPDSAATNAAYSRDGSYFRAVATGTGSEIHHPDGTKHSFTKEGVLFGISDQYGNELTITTITNRASLDNLQACKSAEAYRLTSAWQITDTEGRAHYVCFTDTPRYPKNLYGNQLVKRISVQSPGNQRAVWEFQYKIPVDAAGNKGILRGCWSQMWNDDQYPDVPVLDRLVLPDGSYFQYDYVLDGRDCAQGSLASMRLPTGGALQYTYRFYAVPSGLCGDSGNWTSFSTGVATRQLVDGDTNPKWTYGSEYTPAPGGMHDCGEIFDGSFIMRLPNPEEAMATVVTRPDGAVEKHWYSVWPYGDTSPNGYHYREYALPIKRHTTSGETFLSTETFDTNGTPLRSNYVQYEYDQVPCFGLQGNTWDMPTSCLDSNRRVKTDKTIYHDDGERTAVTKHDDFDGFGHYRKTETTGTFGSDTTRTSITNFNPGTDPNGNRGGAFAFDPLDPWILDTYDSTIQSDGTQAVKTEACFDATGFLIRSRMLKNFRAANGTFTHDTADLLGVFTRNNKGNAVEEKFYGGDCPNPDVDAGQCTGNVPPGNLCDLTPAGSPAYELRHTYAKGVRETTKYYEDGEEMSFKILDRTIDAAGAITCERDTAEVSTCYTYDVMGRVKTATPQGASPTQYTYDNVTSSAPAQVIVRRADTETIFQFDGIGRVWRQKRLMPDGETSIQETKYDNLGRPRYISEFEKLDSDEDDFHPSFGTTYGYDIFGRTTSVLAADGSLSEFDYDGDRVKTRTSRIWTGTGSEETRVSAVEEYDRFGRLISVTERSGPTSAASPLGAEIVTKYGYDVGNRLTTVVMSSGNTEIQKRVFQYDGRGFLTLEQHPESGDTTYSAYDSRGHARRRKSGTRVVDFTFDAAERLKEVGEVTGGTVKPLKSFTFGTQNAGGNAQKGKLVTAVRHNDLTYAGKIEVTETYDYTTPSGQMGKRTTLVERVDGASRTPIQQFQYGVNYDSLMLPRTVTMPKCEVHDCSTEGSIASVTNRRTAGLLTSVDGFGALTYHPSGMVETVKHATPRQATDIYSARHGLPRPSKIQFQGCTKTTPAFTPGDLLVKPEPASCGLRLSWPAATVCGGAGSTRYQVLRDGVEIASCLTELTFLDTSARPGNTYTYQIIAEGPTTDGGTGRCQSGRLQPLDAVTVPFASCSPETSLTVETTTVSVGTPGEFRATLTTPNGPLAEEILTFYLLGVRMGTARTAANGTAILVHDVDVDAGRYAEGIRVEYNSDVRNDATATGVLDARCNSGSFTVIPTALSVPAAAAAYTLRVSTSPRCSWAPGIREGQHFLSIEPKAILKGSGTATVSVTEATSGPREGIVLAGDQVKVWQTAGCSVSFHPSLAYLPAEPFGSTSIEVFAPAGCGWEVRTDANWITLEQFKGTGTGVVRFRAGDNHGKKRKGTIYVEGQERSFVTINQEEAPEVVCPELVVDLLSSFPSGGGLSVTNGQNIVARIGVTGTFLKYRWWIDDDEITSREGSDQMIIGPGDPFYPGPGESVSLQVMAYNSCGKVVSSRVTWRNTGSTTCRVPLLQSSLMRTNEWPSDHTSSTPGAREFLSVVALHRDGTGDFTYDWFEGMSGDDRPGNLIQSGPEDTLVVRPRTTRYYWVRVTDSCGSQRSRTAKITVTQPPPPGRRRSAGTDFTGDGSSDIPMQNVVTGQNELWVMAGTTKTGTLPLPAHASPDARIQSVGDFNADGKPDLLFRDPKTGKNDVWLMHGTFAIPQPLESRADSRWSVGAAADFDNDGHHDLVWHNSATGEHEIWFQSGTEHVGTWGLPATPAGKWGVHGAADFNNDEKPDLFLHDRATGQNSIWIMNDAERLAVTSNGTTSPVSSRQFKVAAQALEPVTDPNLVPALITDMNGDRRPDIVWRNVATGENSVWIMSGVVKVETQTLPPQPDLNWQIGGGGSTNSGSGGGTVPGRTATTMQVAADAPTADLAVAVTATLTAGASPLASRPVVFSLSGRDVTTLLTDANGRVVAALSISGLAPGSYPGAITVRFDGDTDYQPSTAAADLVIRARPATVTWQTPAPIVYGTALSALQLNATADAAGSFLYTPLAGTVLDAGYQTLQVTFTPADTAMAPVRASVALQVLKAPVTLGWAKPEAIEYGTPLQAEQLNATASVAGRFTYDPPGGTILPVGAGQTLRATFTPSTANHEGGAVTTTIDVVKGTQVIQWSDPAPILAGTPLGASELNAKVIVSGTAPAGTPVYDPPAGTILTEGVHELKVTVPETAAYTGASASVDLVVRPRTITVQWAAPAPIVYGTPLSAVQLNATASAAGSFTYTPGPGTILDSGTQQLTAVFTPSDPRYDAVTTRVTIEVLKVKSAIAWSNPVPIVYGTPLSAEELDATANAAGMLVYTPAPGTILDAGTHELSVVFTPHDSRNYDGATAKVRLVVTRAPQTITWATPAPIVYGTPLSSLQLNASVTVVGPAPSGTLTYNVAAGTILNAGNQQLTASVAETANYQPATASVTLEVLKANPVLTWPKPAGIVYGTPLGAAQLNATADVAGSFTYTPAAETILDAGPSQTLKTHFTPADARNYNDAAASVTIDVAKAPQKIVWTAPQPIVYGTPLSPVQLSARVDVVGPAPAGTLTYTPPAGTVLDAGSGQTLSASAAETKNYESASATVTIDVRRAPLSLRADPQSKLYGAPVPPLTGTLTGVVNGDPITASYATTATQHSPAGTYPITATLNDPKSRLVNYDVTITPSTLTVNPAPLLVAANAASKQYSDPLPLFTASYTGFVLNEGPSVLGGTLVLETTAQPRSAPGTYPITIGGLTSPNYAITYANSTLTVTAEDARVSIISPRFLTTASAGATTVMLAATVQDISATADAAGDVHPGDIRTATLAMIDRGTNAVLCTATIGLSNPADERTGVATCTFTRDFGAALPASLVIGARVAGYYTRDAAADDATLAVVTPTPDFVTGGGTLTLATAAGSRAPDTPGTAKFELNLQYQKSGEVNGKFTLHYTRTEQGSARKYELTLAPGASLSIQRTAAGGTAAIAGTATIRDVTVPSAPVLVVEAAPLVVTATDNGEPSTNDAVSVTVYDRTGGLWLAAGWNGVRAVEQPVRDGNLAVHYKK